MDSLTTSDSQYSLTPLEAGDLIDRAIRFYRKNFWTFVWIAAPPIIAGTLISIGWRILARGLFNVDMVGHPGETYFYYFFLQVGNLIIWLVETVATFTVMGGASRNFVRHLLFGESITFRETYRNVKARVFGLITASTLITILLGVIGGIIFMIGYTISIFAVVIAVYAFSFSPFLTWMISLVLVLATVFGAGWLFFLIASNFAYVPQAMLVEGQGVFSAIGRSASLAGGKAKRLYALFVFSAIAIYSGLMLFKIPLDWYAWANGIDIWKAYVGFEPIPAWYEIAGQFIWQTSLILLMPVWMIGLCLLYVDERVRHEGYDIELLAARRLGEIPAVPREFVNPLHSALSQQAYVANPPPNQSPPVKRSSHSTLGLD
jgi:hypothetical protein